MTMFKIKDKGGNYSRGRVKQSWSSDDWGVDFDTKGKIWKDVKGIKSHLMKAMTKGIDMKDWEVVEWIEKPTKPITEWFDQNMFAKILKGKK